MIHQIKNYLKGLGFTKSERNGNLYHILVDDKFLILVLYLDDLTLTGNENFSRSCKEDIAREFNMKDMGLMHYFHGLEEWQGDGELFVSQGKYDTKILQRFHMENCKPMDTPLATNWRKEYAFAGCEFDSTLYRKLVGSFMYLVNT